MQISSAPPSTICRELLVDGCKKSKSYEAWPALAAPKKLERPHVPFPKLLRAFALERHHKRRVAIRQAHHEERHLPQLAIHVGQRMAEVHLHLAGTMQQRHKHLLVLLRHLQTCAGKFTCHYTQMR
jgi:hypothetical protein